MKVELENILGFFPESAQTKWDGDIEVSPVYCNEKGECEVVEEGEENMWSLYLHQAEGGVQCAADLPDKKRAHDLAQLLENALRSYVSHQPVKVRVALGESASRLAADIGYELAQKEWEGENAENGGEFKIEMFATQAEANAYLQGLNDADGWLATYAEIIE